MTTIAQHNKKLAGAGLPTVETLTRRILAVFDRATVSNLESGATWYDDARAFARVWAAETTYNLEECAAVLSHLSPRTSWTRNVMGAADLLRYGKRGDGVIGSNYDRAVASLSYADPIDSFGPRAQKTRSFYLNILGDEEAVTVDVWAARVADVDEDLLKRVGVYEAVATAYRRAAHRRGVTPATMQATTWIVARNGRAS